MTRYRTIGYLAGSTGMVLYHGLSYQSASQTWHDAAWASERVIERLDDDGWRVVVGGYNL